MNDRLNRLMAFLEDDPDDPFNYYLLAIDYQKTEPQKAVEYFRKLLKDFPDYLATYYHAAALFADLDYRDEAEEAYQKGIALADQQNEQMARRELQSAYDEFLFE